MKDLIEIVKESYEQLPSLPGYYRKLSDLLETVNRTLERESQEQVKVDSLTTLLQENFKVTIIEEYNHGDETFSAIRIQFPHVTPTLSIDTKNFLRRSISTVLLSKMEHFDGWYEQVKIAPILKAAGIDYKEHGFMKLTELLMVVFDDDYKCEKSVDPNRPNVEFVYLNVENYAEENTIPFSQKSVVPAPSKATKSSPTKKVKKLSAYEKLMNFAAFTHEGRTKGYDYAIRQLSEKALRENWHYGTSINGKYPILKNYLQLTFERLLAEDEEHASDPTWKKKILTTEKNAVFNTGLVDQLYEPVYALFFKNNPNERRWIFWTFVKSNDREHQFLTRTFGTNLPAPAHYYNSTSELVYNIKKEIGSYNWDHFIDNCSRLPIEFLRDNGPDNFDYDQEKSKDFFKRLAEAIKNNPRSMNRIKNRITDAIEYAIKRVRWNFKTAIPIYYPGQKQISLLLPLALVDDERIDVALVLEATKSGAYIAHTILSLQMAYTNARLITRPDSDWLTAETIIVTEDE